MRVKSRFTVLTGAVVAVALIAACSQSSTAPNHQVAASTSTPQTGASDAQTNTGTAQGIAGWDSCVTVPAPMGDSIAQLVQCSLIPEASANVNVYSYGVLSLQDSVNVLPAPDLSSKTLVTTVTTDANGNFTVNGLHDGYYSFADAFNPTYLQFEKGGVTGLTVILPHP